MENNLFDQIARNYDTKERQALATIIAEAIKPELRNSDGKTLLDYGCGTGLVGLGLSSLVGRLILVDSSEQMLEAAQEKIRRADLKNAIVVQSDFISASTDIKADIVVASLVLLHIPDTGKILKQFHSVLHDDGKLIIVDFDKNENVSHPALHNGFDQMELASLLGTLGFKDIKIRTFYQGKNIFMNQDASMWIATCMKQGDISMMKS